MKLKENSSSRRSRNVSPASGCSCAAMGGLQNVLFSCQCSVWLCGTENSRIQNLDIGTGLIQEDVILTPICYLSTLLLNNGAQGSQILQVHIFVDNNKNLVGSRDGALV